MGTIIVVASALMIQKAADKSPQTCPLSKSPTRASNFNSMTMLKVCPFWLPFPERSQVMNTREKCLSLILEAFLLHLRNPANPINNYDEKTYIHIYCCLTES